MLSVIIRVFMASLFAIAASMASTLAALAEESPNSNNLIPRSLLFADPSYAAPQLSPDGRYLAYLAPHEGVLNVWVEILGQPDTMKPITQNQKRGVSGFSWSYNTQYILYSDDENGDENTRLYRVDIRTGEKTDLFSKPGVKVGVLAASQYYPNEVIIWANDRRPEFFDVYRTNILTGKSERIYQNNRFVGFIPDDHLNLKIATETKPDGGYTLYTVDKNFDTTELTQVKAEDFDTTSPLALNKAGDILYMLDSRDTNTAALTSIDLNSKQTTLILADKRADISDVLFHPTERKPQAISVEYLKSENKLIDKSLDSDIAFLKKLEPTHFDITSRSLDDRHWIVVYYRDNGSPHYYHYDRAKRDATFLFAAKPGLDKVALTSMDPVIIQSRDRLPLISYLSLPLSVRSGPAKAKSPVPLILYVHGGPHLRDSWQYEARHQWLANRGYAVLSVNYRGSAGFGKQFLNAGDGEWGRKMHEDLLDAVNWAIQQGITTKDKVAILGGSYGGYATLVGMTMTPEVFACGVDIVGISNLQTFVNSIPEYWKPLIASIKKELGADPETEEGKKLLTERSPITYVNNIKKPLLIGQGANDPRVKQAESDQIVDAMKAKGIPVTYILYPDEGHGFRRPENRMSFFAVTEAFLSKNLGGKFEPIDNDFNNSSIEIKEGKQYIPGL